MQSISINDRTFFIPGIRLQGKSEHALRMCTVHNLGKSSGAIVFDSISTNKPSTEKLAAISVLENFLDEVNALESDDPDKADLAWEMGLAAETRFHQFAVEDVATVSQKMSDIIIKFFEVTKNIEDDGVKQKKSAIVRSFHEKANYDYERYFPDAQRIPNDRAARILLQLQKIDPVLIASLELAPLVEPLPITRPQDAFVAGCAL